MPEVNSWLQPLNQAKDVALSIARWIPPTTAGMADDADLAFAPSVFQAEFRALLPVELPAPLIVVPLEPAVPAPALPPLDPAAEPPAAPPAPPPACASANVLERAKAVANAIVVILMVGPLGCCCSSNDNLRLMFRRPESD